MIKLKMNKFQFYQVTICNVIQLRRLTLKLIS